VAEGGLPLPTLMLNPILSPSIKLKVLFVWTSTSMVADTVASLHVQACSVDIDRASFVVVLFRLRK